MSPPRLHLLKEGFDVEAHLSYDFNWWAWFVPSKTAWSTGKRWLRCDGMIVTNIRTAKSTADYKFKTWNGAKL